MVLSGRPVPEVAETLGVSRHWLRTWVRQTQPGHHERDDRLAA